MNKYSNNFLNCNTNFADAEIVLFGAPFDSTTSYRSGARFASRAMRTESQFGIESYSPYQDKDLSDMAICDWGDLELAFGNSERTLKEIEDLTRLILNSNKIPFMIGGEHLVTLGAIKAAAEKYKDLVIIHFDAHLDLREELLGEALSHGTVMRRAWDILGDNRIYQFGIRSGTKEEFDWASKHVVTNRYNLDNINKVMDIIGNKPVYISMDLDVLDPSIMSGTGTPEAGGVLFNDMLNTIIKLGNLNIIGADMVELSPAQDISGASTVLACKLLREMLLSIA